MPLPEPGDRLPRRGNRLSRGLGRAILRVMGWDFVGAVPDLSRMVVIAAPHTSNWDFVIAMATLLALGLDVHWIGKHTLFRPPLGWLMRRLGGTPVDRSARQGVVSQMVEAFEQREQFLMGLSPEGTRKRVEAWKTGFYRLAEGAGVPILPAFFDYAHKKVGVGPLFHPTGDLEADLAKLRAFYAPFTGKNPDRA